MAWQVVANNMMAAVYNDHVDNAENDAVIVTTFRIACAVPPLLCALLWRDFAAIVGYAGEREIEWAGRTESPAFVLLRVKMRAMHSSSRQCYSFSPRCYLHSIDRRKRREVVG